MLQIDTVQIDTVQIDTVQTTQPPKKSFAGSELVDARKMSWFQIGIVALIALSILMDGFDSNILSLSIPSLVREWRLPASRFAIVTAMAGFATLVGAPLAGVANDRIGRRWSLVLATGLYGSASFAASFAHDIGWLLVCRFLSGAGLGGTLVVATTSIAEHTPAARRALTISIAILGMPFGAMLAGFAGAAVIVPLGWPALFIIGGVVPMFLALLFMAVLPESPAFLSRSSLGHAALDRYFRRAGVPLEVDVVVTPIGPIGTRSGGVLAVFRPDLARDTLLVWIGIFFALLASYTVQNWLPTLLAQRGADPIAASSGLSFWGAGSLLGGISAAPLVFGIGSRRAMIGAAALAGLLASGLVWFFDTSPTALAVMLSIAALGGLFSILNVLVYALLPSLYPDDVRSMGMGLAIAVGRLGSVASAFVGAWALKGGGRLFFAVITVTSVLALLGYGSIRKHAPVARSKGQCLSG